MKSSPVLSHACSVGCLRSEYLWPPVLVNSCCSSILLANISDELDVGVLLWWRQFSCKISRYFARSYQFLVAYRMGIAFQVEQLPLVREDVLHPQACCIRM